MELSLPDSGATEALGRAMAVALPDTARSGAVVHLRGDLGTGKTTLVRALLQRLGVVGKVRSPTYTLIDRYDLPALGCVHIDLYRVQSPSEVEELGLRDLAGAGCLMLIEWPEHGSAAVPAADLLTVLTYAGEARQMSIEPRSALGDAWQTKLVHDDSLSSYVSNLT